MKSGIAPTKPEELRPILHGEIDLLNADDLPLVHRVLLQLKAERLANKITEGFEKDGTIFDQIDQTILEFRKRQPYK
jgi:hypothetical protein